jgi:hypothetical protein
MSGDILHHRPARPTTILPGHWLIDLRPETPIQIRRYRARDQSTDTHTREQALLDNALDTHWRELNSRGNGTVKDILFGGCATIVISGENERELWVFGTTPNCLDESSSLEREPILLSTLPTTQLIHRHPTRPRLDHSRRSTSMYPTWIYPLMPLSTIHESKTNQELRSPL